jgi:hypothetical protein
LPKAAWKLAKLQRATDEAAPESENGRLILAWLTDYQDSIKPLDLNSEIETADSADFTDFEEVIGDERTNLFAAKLQGDYNCNLLYPFNLRLNPFSVFGLNAPGKA